LSNKLTIIRYSINDQNFEIFVNPDRALEYKLKKTGEISKIIAMDEVFTDSAKGLRASDEKMKKHLGTSDSTEGTKIILEKGTLQLTTEQRKKMILEKKRRVVQIISNSFVDPKTHIPHPPIRIEQAMQQSRVSVDPYKDEEEQITKIVEELRKILPMSSETTTLDIKIPAQFAPQCIGVLKNSCDRKGEKWEGDGTYTAQIEISAATKTNLLEKLNSITKGSIEASEVK